MTIKVNGRPTAADLEYLRRTYPKEYNPTIGMLLEEIATLNLEVAELRVLTDVNAAIKSSWGELVTKSRIESY